ncbi:polysaccharide deacetylase family protein [Priestia megaterium]|uniref:polysaccharide deacetylase family protein n=1 Tax=Priestia megaterium TaxID=1404 RepID=UPI001642CE54|nr:polysaccharide deacetylase family protein [Priestia megaterium]
MNFINSPTKKKAYLTFDDGPSENTIKILEILDLYKIKATFFVVGPLGEIQESLYKTIVEKGHTIGLHSYTHDYSIIYSSIDLFLEDLNKLEKLLVEKVGFVPSIYRFPGGSSNQVSKRFGGPFFMNKLKEVIKEKGYTFFDWNIDSGDTKGYLIDFDDIIENVRSNILDKENVILLMHDSPVKTTTVQALPEIINNLKKQGFDFKTLSKGSFCIQFKI